MNVILCLDKRNGMLFNGRRQSADRALRKRLAQVIGHSSLWMNAYSAQQFSDFQGRLFVDEGFLVKAGAQNYCFVENTDITKHIPEIRTLTVYRWDRSYPFDTALPEALADKLTVPVSTVQFEGYSHETITEEVYHL